MRWVFKNSLASSQPSLHAVYGVGCHTRQSRPFRPELQRRTAQKIFNPQKNAKVRLDAVGYSIFFDEFFQAELWGRHLSIALADVYARDARFCSFSFQTSMFSAHGPLTSDVMRSRTSYRNAATTSFALRSIRLRFPDSRALSVIFPSSAIPRTRFTSSYCSVSGHHKSRGTE